MCSNAFMYADDLLLLALSVGELQKMIEICKTELDWLDMSINAKKSGCIRIGPQFNVVGSKLVIGTDSIEWLTELPYLGLVIKAARSFKCCFHSKKIKFYRSVNGILGRLGSAPPINVALSLIFTNCNPILLYGLEALKLSKTDLNALSHPYNSVYMKLFNSFDKNVITKCQFYCGDLPFEHYLHFRTLNFYTRLNELEFSPANLLFKWTGSPEFHAIAIKYNVVLGDQPYQIREKVHQFFSEAVNAMKD
jgi:hypothetical protein